MTIPTITPPPTPPSRSDDPDTFVARADAFVAWLDPFTDEMNAAITAIQNEATATNYNGNSTTSVTIGTGIKNFTMDTGKLLQPGQFVTVASTASPSNFMYGQVISYNSGTGALSVNVTAVGGAGTIASWSIALAAYTGASLGIAGGTLAGLLTLIASASGQESLVIPHGAAPSSPTNGSVWTTTAGKFVRINGTTYKVGYRTPQVVTDAGTSGTMTPTSDTADQYIMAGLTGGITVAAPSGTPVQGQKLMLRIKDNGTSRTVSWNAIYRAFGNTAIPSATTLGKTLYVGCVYNSTDTKWDVVGIVTEQ